MRNTKSSRTCGSLRSASSRRQCGSSVPRLWLFRRGHQFRNGKCNGSCCVTSSSVGSLCPRFNRGARSSNGRFDSCFFLSWSAGNKASVSASRSMTLAAAHFHRVTRTSTRHGVSQLSERTVRVPGPASSGVHQSGCALHSWRSRLRNPLPQNL